MRSKSTVFYQEWLILLLIFVIGGFLRFWQLGDLPPGLYRDEAYNGLDALEILRGNHALFFAANNGREPFYIYGTALAVWKFGRNALAVRLTAALAGTLTTLPTFFLTRRWFGSKIALLTALLWATTLWPVHLSRIGFRTILLPLTLSTALALATRAYQNAAPLSRHPVRFLLPGLVYGLTFYTYLASRLTPFFLIILLSYLVILRRPPDLFRQAAWFAFGTGLALLPFVGYLLQHPELLAGRTGQVSILHPDINQGDFWGTLWRHIRATALMFLVKGDTIVRHNPAGRPIFDAFMAIPFLIGLLISLRKWRRTPYAAALIWTGILLWGTILAEDAPHFLRGIGILPVILIFPAIGLSHFLSWSKLPRNLRYGFVGLLLVGSITITVRDYFWEYGLREDAYYLFESAVRELAQEVNQEDSSAIYVDQRFLEAWPSFSFLVGSETHMILNEMETTSADAQITAFYVWPHGSRDIVAQAVRPPAIVQTSVGSKIRGDLDQEAVPLYVRYRVEKGVFRPILANYADEILLHNFQLNSDQQHLTIDLLWSAPSTLERPLTAFIHILNRADMTLIAQSDTPPGGGNWLQPWWQPELYIGEQRQIDLPTTYHPDQHLIVVGVYDAQTTIRLQAVDSTARPLGDHWQYQPEQ